MSDKKDKKDKESPHPIAFIRNALSINAFCHSKKLSDEEIEVVRESYVETSIRSTFFLALILAFAMLFYFVYGLATHFFFNGTYYGTIKLASVSFTFLVGFLAIIIYFVGERLDFKRKTVETILFLFQIFVLIGVFLFSYHKTR